MPNKFVHPGTSKIRELIPPATEQKLLDLKRRLRRGK